MQKFVRSPNQRADDIVLASWPRALIEGWTECEVPRMAEGGIAKEPRYLVSEGAVIKFGDRSINCLVRNLSETGAAIEVPNESGIPAQFELRIVRLGLIMLCRVVWRKDHRIGVAFVRTAPGDGSTV